MVDVLRNITISINKKLQLPSYAPKSYRSVLLLPSLCKLLGRICDPVSNEQNNIPLIGWKGLRINSLEEMLLMLDQRVTQTVFFSLLLMNIYRIEK